MKYLSSSFSLFSSSILFLRASSFSKTSLICSFIQPSDKVLNFGCMLPRPSYQVVQIRCCHLRQCLLKCHPLRCKGVEDTSFDKICCDLGVNFELAKSIAFCSPFCPALRAMFKAVSRTCFLLMNPDKKSLSFEKIREPPTWYFRLYPRLIITIFI